MAIHIVRSVVMGLALFAVGNVRGAESTNAGPANAKIADVLGEEPYRLTTKPTERVVITIEQPLGPQIMAVMFPVPPDTQSQKVVGSELTVETPDGTLQGARGNDVGRLRKPMLGVRLRKPTEGKAVVKLELDLSTGKLEAAKPQAGEAAQPVPPLVGAERAAHLASEWHYEFDTPWFQAWMKEHGLVRSPQERDIDFAYRVLAFMQQHFVYKIPPRDQMQAKKAAANLDDLGYFCTEQAAECWGLSRIYTSVLRAGGVPCRQVSGFMLRDGAERQGGHHVRAEVFLGGIGWVLVELAGATNGKKRSPLEFFGKGGDDMALISRGVNYKVPGPKGPGSVGTLSGFAMVTPEGKWSFPHGTWKVEKKQ